MWLRNNIIYMAFHKRKTSECGVHHIASRGTRHVAVLYSYQVGENRGP